MSYVTCDLFSNITEQLVLSHQLTCTTSESVTDGFALMGESITPTFRCSVELLQMTTYGAVNILHRRQ